MHKNIAAQTASKKAEQEKVIKEIQQLENRQKILLNKQRNEERKARTRRLIEHGAILEGVFPAVAAMTGEEAKAFLDYLMTDEAMEVFESVGFASVK